MEGAETPDWLQDALRGAAAGAATGTLGAPVDLAAMLLRPLGYGHPMPAGGSEWWRQLFQNHGFYQPRTGSVAETVGETVGSLLAPGPDASALSHGIGLGLPLFMGVFSRAQKPAVLDLHMPSWRKGAPEMSFSVEKNPRRSTLEKLARGGSFRALRDPATGDIYAWPANEALHADVAQKLGLDFRTRNEVLKNSFLYSKEQLEEAKHAKDLDDLVKAFGG